MVAEWRQALDKRLSLQVLRDATPASETRSPIKRTRPGARVNNDRTEATYRPSDLFERRRTLTQQLASVRPSPPEHLAAVAQLRHCQRCAASFDMTLLPRFPVTSPRWEMVLAHAFPGVGAGCP